MNGPPTRCLRSSPNPAMNPWPLHRLRRRLLAAAVLLCALMASPWTQAATLDFLAQRLRPLPLPEQMHLVNLAINGLDHVPRPDAWQTPAELLQRGAGDCKDLAYAKFWLLAQVARGHREMRLGYGHVHLDGRWQPHLVVLVWSDDGSPWVLDNVTPVVVRLSSRPDLSLQLSFDEHSSYTGVSDTIVAGPKVRGWSTLQARMGVEAAPFDRTAQP